MGDPRPHLQDYPTAYRRERLAMRLDGHELSRMLAAARARQPKATALLGAYVDDLLTELDARQGKGRADDFRERMDALRARHPSTPMPVPASPVAPPAPYQDPDEDSDAT